MPAKRLPWIKMWEQALTHPKVALLPDPLFRTWVHCLIAGSQQAKRWQFASVQHAAIAAGRPGVHIAKLIEAGLLDQDDSGGLTVHDWKDWQEVYPSRYPKKQARPDPSNTSKTLGHDPDKKGEGRRETGEGRRETTLSSGLETTPAHVSAGGETPGANAAVAAAPPTRGKREAEVAGSGEGLEPLLHEFTTRGLDQPQLLSRFEKQAAADLLRVFGPETVALCWKDLAENGDPFDRSRLSFEYLAKGNRIANWKRERGLPSPSADEYDAEAYGEIVPFRRAAT